MTDIMDSLEDHPDFVVLSLGFYAGYQGINMIDYFMQGAEPTGVAKLKSNIQTLEDIKINVPSLNFWPFNSGSGSGSSSEVSVPVTLRSFLTTDWSTMDPDLPTEYYDAVAAKLALGCMGAIMAYAFTRPGFLPSLMQLAGSVLKDLGSGVVPIVA